MVMVVMMVMMRFQGDSDDNDNNNKNDTEFKVHGSVHRNNTLTYIQKYATLHSLFYL